MKLSVPDDQSFGGSPGASSLSIGRGRLAGQVSRALLGCKRGLAAAVQAACAKGCAIAVRQFQGMSSSQREAGQSLAILAMTSAI